MFLLYALLGLAQAADPALTFSYRGMLGASVRMEVPSSDTVSWFGEVGGSSWLIPGDVGGGGENVGSVLDLRGHLKVGTDYTAASGFYAGPRVVGAYNHVINGGGDFIDIGAMGTVGVKVSGGDHAVLQLGGGLGAYAFVRSDDWIVLPLPHVELRFGPTL